MDKITSEITSYFKSEQWLALIKLLQKKHHEEVYHAHIFVDTKLHPYTLREVIFSYFKCIDMPIDRPIDFQVSNVGNIMAHNIHPQGTFHFDLAFRYNPDVVLSAMPNEIAFRKSNLQFWGKKETYDFIDQFPFRKDVPINQIVDYFHSSEYKICSNWSEYKYFVLDRRMVHFHANVETSIHPDLIKQATIELIEKEGWTNQLIVHCIFYPNRDWKAGKVCFLMSDPMFNFDIAWDYNPEVLIQPSRKYFITKNRPDFDLRYEEPEQKMMSTGDYMPEISFDELREIEKSIKAIV